MKVLCTWANRITFARIGLVFLIVILVYSKNVWAHFIASIFPVIIVVLDAFDGYLARRFNEVTVIGGVLDIAADHIFHCVLLIVLADLQLIPLWIPIFVVSRDILADSIRGYVLRYGYTAFGKNTMMQTPVGRFLTYSPWMTSSYAGLKAFVFSWLIIVSNLKLLWWHWLPFPQTFVAVGLRIGYWAAVSFAIMSLVRGLPVLIEGVVLIRKMESETPL